MKKLVALAVLISVTLIPGCIDFESDREARVSDGGEMLLEQIVESDVGEADAGK